MQDCDCRTVAVLPVDTPPMPAELPHVRAVLPTLAVAAALALAAAVSLGLARFSYALLLPPMRSDLGWSYFTAGAMNTVNAAGYLAGALLMPACPVVPIKIYYF